ncbi:putative Eukaryotic translation initiation factor 4E [Blattamonas nauphoetae]|uniref:Eukaryotic translation initiation factor 4E n=1 Tax=Blattamonas nauphoetae TaxID=2049346 RepID=A0ABQ9X3J1_9EUKA|nr:putative Eukaryotic translation initiation factor 4E [Blattamonas nauphoetae]
MTLLQSKWVFWYDRKQDYVNDNSGNPDIYINALHNLGSFSTIEDFWKLISNICTVDNLPRDVNLNCFREGYRPMWEELPEGGSWVLKYRERTFRVPLWEDLLMHVIQESFEEPEVVGIGLNIRQKEDCLSIWIRTATPEIKARVENYFRLLLNLDRSVALEFKSHATSLRSIKSTPMKREPVSKSENAEAKETIKSEEKSE